MLPECSKQFLPSYEAFISLYFKDTHIDKTPLNKTPVLRKSMNMNMWVAGSLNQLFIRGFSTETNFFKN